MNLRKNRPRIVYMGSPAFAGELLRYIIEHGLADVQSVWTAPPRLRSSQRNRKQTMSSETTPVGKVAQKYDIPLYEPEILAGEAANWLTREEVDFGFVVAYGKIIPKSLLTLPKQGMFNLHFSLLPRHRGASPLTAAILAGDQETGITIQKITPRLDAGPIILQRAFPNRDLNYESVLRLSLAKAEIAFKTFFQYWQESPVQLPFREQDEKQATYCYKLHARDTKVGSHDTATSLYRKMLAFDKWKGVYFMLKGIQYFIEEIQVVSAKTFYQKLEVKTDESLQKHLASLPSGSPHLIRTVNRNLLFWFSADDNLIEILAVKQAGKRRIRALDFINAQRDNFPLKLDS